MCFTASACAFVILVNAGAGPDRSGSVSDSMVVPPTMLVECSETDGREECPCGEDNSAR